MPPPIPDPQVPPAREGDALDAVDALAIMGVHFAATLLAKHGSFYPFALVRDARGEPRIVVGSEITPHMGLRGALVLLEAYLSEEAKSAEVEAAALLVNVTYRRDGAGEPVDAIFVRAHHAGRTCERLVACAVEDGAVTLRESPDPAVPSLFGPFPVRVEPARS